MEVSKFKVLLYLKKSGLDKQGKAPIMGRITLNDSMAQFSCKLSCKPELWNPRESRLNGKSKEAVETNERIEKLLLAVNSAFDSLIARQVDFSATDVKEMFQGSVKTQMTLMDAVNKMCGDLEARVGVDRKNGTLVKYNYMRQRLQEFIQTKYKSNDVAFGQLTEQFIYDFQDYVTDEVGNKIDTAKHYLALLKKACRMAFKEGNTDKQYFAHFKLPVRKCNTPKALSREQFEAIRDMEIGENRPQHRYARDLFLFACYTGVPYGDAVTITRENLVRDKNGDLWLKYKRVKNQMQAAVKLLPEALELIEKYHDDNRETLFPHMECRALMEHMRGIGIRLGIKGLRYHMGRHSFSTLITLEEGVPIETISRMLGHTNIETTQVYAKVTPQKLFDDMDKFIEATKDLKLTLY